MILNSFEFDGDFASNLYYEIQMEFDVTRGDAQGLVDAKSYEIEKLYKAGKTVEEIISIVWPWESHN